MRRSQGEKEAGQGAFLRRGFRGIYVSVSVGVSVLGKEIARRQGQKSLAKADFCGRTVVFRTLPLRASIRNEVSELPVSQRTL